jgi:hypothetical protein
MVFRSASRVAISLPAPRLEARRDISVAWPASVTAPLTIAAFMSVAMDAVTILLIHAIKTSGLVACNGRDLVTWLHSLNAKS